MIAVCCSLRAVGCSACVVCWLLLVPCCVNDARCLLSVVRWLLFVVRCVVVCLFASVIAVLFFLFDVFAC